MARHKDTDWNLPAQGWGHADARLAVLMDIRDELKRLNSLLHCHNFIGIPATLRRIDRRVATNLPLKKGRTK